MRSASVTVLACWEPRVRAWLKRWRSALARSAGRRAGNALARSAQPCPERGAGAPRGDHRHVAVLCMLGLGAVGLEVQAARHRAQHDALLGHRERRPQAAPCAAAEWDPLIRAGLAREPALGAERERLRVEVLTVVQKKDADADGAGRR